MAKELLLTVAEIAGRFGVPIHRVNYIIETRGIAETFRPGGVRVYDAEAVEAVRKGLSEASERYGRV